MFSWIANAVGNVASWLGDGVASFFGWLFGGLELILTKLIDAAGGFWQVLTSLWGFTIGLKDTVFTLLSTYFPFIPAPVLSVIILGLIAVMVAGIYKKVRN